MSTNHHHPGWRLETSPRANLPQSQSPCSRDDFLSPPALLPPPQQDANLFHFFLLLNGQPLACGPDIKEAVALS